MASTSLRANAGVQCTNAICVILLVTLLFSPSAATRPVASGWDLSLSAGSSDFTIWRKFATPAQANSYHRLLLDLESNRNMQEVTAEKEAGANPVQDFNTMDYAFPRSNEPGSSDASTPPAP